MHRLLRLGPRENDEPPSCAQLTLASNLNVQTDPEEGRCQAAKVVVGQRTWPPELRLEIHDPVGNASPALDDCGPSPADNVMRTLDRVTSRRSGCVSL